MSTYVVLLKGINVAGKNILPMKELVSLLEEMGYRNIKTYIQSGNVVLQGRQKPGVDVSAAVGKKFGFEPAVFSMDNKNLSRAFEKNPFKAGEGKYIYFFFCDRKPKTVNEAKLKELKVASERYVFADSVFYLYAPEGIARSKLAAGIDKCLGVSVTCRNLNTVRKLQNMTGSAAS